MFMFSMIYSKLSVNNITLLKIIH